MYVSSNSNYGNAFPNSAGIYRINNCTTCGTSCTLVKLPQTTVDIFDGKGNFEDPTTPFPYAGWYVSGWEKTPALLTGNYIRSFPDDTASRVEMSVYGSYLQTMTYNVTFKITLPPHTEVYVVMKDSHPNNQYHTDWGNNPVSPTAWSSMLGYYEVGPGYSTTGTPLDAGHYINDSSGTLEQTVTTTVTAYDYVNRLEFGSHKLSGYTGGDIRLDNIVITQEYDDLIYNMRTSPVSSGTFFCLTAKGERLYKLHKVSPSGGGFVQTDFDAFPPTMVDNHHTSPQNFTISSVSPNIIYFYRKNTTRAPKIVKFDLSSPSSYTEDPYTLPELHADIRCLLAFPNSGGTDDILYAGHDGGIAKGGFSSHWTGLNGTGLRTSWLNDVGSSIWTGELGVAATDNGVFWSSSQPRNKWKITIDGDGGQYKFGRSPLTRSVRYTGFTNGGPGFTTLYYHYMGGSPAVYGGSIATSVFGLTKMANTFHGDFFGTAFNECHVFKLKKTGGTSSSGYVLEFLPITVGSGYSIRQPVQAIGADMFDSNYVVVYTHEKFYESGQFAYSYNASAATPTWLFKANNTANGGVNSGLTTLVVDPDAHSSGKRLWAGGAGYGTANRVIQGWDAGTGATWSDMSHGLPKSPVNALVYDPESHYLFAGTDQGIYAFYVDGAPNSSSNPWVCYSLNLPNTYVTGLDINRCTGKIYASSFGRGVYQAELPTPNAEVITTGSPVVWSQDKHQFRNIIVPSGANFTILNCNIYMGRDMSIRVMPGGKLTVQNATITNNCEGCFWAGISAIGNPSIAQVPATNQGQVSIFNSKIAHARAAISNYDYTSSTPLTNTGGIIHAIGSTFENNYNCVLMQPYTAPETPAVPDRSYFKGCTFVNTTKYRGYDVSLPLKAQMSLSGVHGIKIAGCSFINRDWRNYKVGEGVGIRSFNSSISVVPYCSSPVLSTGGCLGSWRRPYFAGLENGVVLKTSLWNDEASYIDKSDFDSVSVGVLISGQNWVTVTGSNFVVGRANPFDSSVSTINSCGNIGIAVLNTSHTYIGENRFVGRVASGAPYASVVRYGAIVVGAGGIPKEIMKNAFDSLTEGIRSVGNNRVPVGLPSLTSGLQIKCNNFNRNNTDIAVTPFSSSTSQGIGPELGFINNPVKNTFSSSLVNIDNSGQPFNYNYHSSFTTTERPGGTPAGVTIVGTANINNNCVVPFRAPGSGGVSSLGSSADIAAMDMAALSALKSDFHITHTTLLNNMTLLAQELDMGEQATYLKNYIDTATNDTALYELLLSASPWLSDDVILHVPTSGVLSYDQMDSILVANPDALRHPDVLGALTTFFAELQQNDPLLPDYVAHLNAATQFISDRTELEVAISTAKENRDTYGNKILFALASLSDTSISVNDTTGLGICMDSTSVYYTTDSNSRYYGVDSLATWLNLIGGSDAVYERMALHLSKGQYQIADSLYHQIDSNMIPDVELPSYISIGKLMNVMNSVYGNDRTIYALSAQDIAALDTFTHYSSTDNKGRMMLWNLSTHLLDLASYSTGLPSSFPPIMDVICESTIIGSPRQTPSNTSHYHRIIGRRDTKQLALSVFPNPAKDVVVFDYRIPERISKNGQGRLVITNILGEQVALLEISENIGKLQWNCKNMASGIYVYQLTSSTGVLATGKVIVVR